MFVGFLGKHIMWLSTCEIFSKVFLETLYFCTWPCSASSHHGMEHFSNHFSPLREKWYEFGLISVRLQKLAQIFTLTVFTDNLLHKLFFSNIISLEETIKKQPTHTMAHQRHTAKPHFGIFFPLCVRGGLFSSLSMWVIRVVNSFRGGLKDVHRICGTGAAKEREMFFPVDGGWLKRLKLISYRNTQMYTKECAYKYHSRDTQLPSQLFLSGASS